jgi:hypothetical protein
MGTMSEIVLPERLELVEALGKIHDAVNTLNSMSGGVELIVKQLNDIIDGSHDMSRQIYQRDELLEQASKLICGLEASALEMQKQRDAVLDEMSEIINRLKSGQFFNGGQLEREVYNAAMETHNSAFWESLPYDLAETLGEGWSFVEARFLFDLINDDPEEAAASVDLETEDVIAFREVLLEMVEKLMQSSPMKMLEDES